MKKIFSLIMVLMMLFGIAVPGFASDLNKKSNDELKVKSVEICDYLTEMNKLEKLESGNSILGKDSLKYMKSVFNQSEMLDLIRQYKSSFPNIRAYRMLKENINSTYQEVVANGFNKVQAKKLLIAAAGLETDSIPKSEMEFTYQTPDFAPRHINNGIDINGSNIEGFNSQNLGLNSNPKGANDKSSRTSTEEDGVGYEVQSKTGFNKTTTFLNAGACNITASQGKAGYMFYTIRSNDNFQDLGIAYYDGQWKVFVSGHWTGWETANVSIDSGDKLYFKIWINSDQEICFQILDGNDFSNIIFNNSYSSEDQIPENGNGVGFNKQITLVDTAHNPNSWLYLKNAKYNQSYLYNNSTPPQKFVNSTTVYSRRGKFGCSWASDSKVTIHSNTHWDSEKVTIYMK